MTDVHSTTSEAAPGPETAELDAEATRPFGTGPAEPPESGAGGASGASATGAGWGRWAWRQLTSMRTALILLFLLALGSVPGSILPQQGSDPASVTQYFTSHPALAPWLNRLGLFNVFAAPWFAAIYILLFASLVGCVVPRTFKLVGSARTPPPRAPRNLARLPQSATYPSALSPDAAVDAAAAVLGGQRFRLRRPAAGDAGHWLAAEKGYLREVGNLLFHLSLLGVLLSIAIGGLFGYKADELVTEGQTFTDTNTQLAEFHPGRLVSGSDLAPFSLKLDKFTADYIDTGASIGQPAGFDANVSYTATPGGPSKNYDIQVNHPLSVDSVKVYLIGHGYAPEFKVTGPNGVAYDQATPFIPANTNTMLSDGVVKASSASLGFEGVFVPTAYMANGTTLESIFPAANNPEVSLIGYNGQPRPELGHAAERLPARHQPDDGDPGRTAPDDPRQHLEAAGQARVDHLRRHRAVGQPRDHLRPGADPRPRLRDPRDRRPAAVVLHPAAAGVRPGGPRAGRRRLGRHHRRPDQDRRQRRVRGRVRLAGGRHRRRVIADSADFADCRACGGGRPPEA